VHDSHIMKILVVVDVTKMAENPLKIRMLYINNVIITSFLLGRPEIIV